VITEEIICDEEVGIEMDASWGVDPQQQVVAEPHPQPQQPAEPPTTIILNKRFLLDAPKTFVIAVPEEKSYLGSNSRASSLSPIRFRLKNQLIRPE